MLVYRVVFKVFSKELIASGFEGRWNRESNKVIYTAGSIALALLENMVRRQGVGFNDDYKIMIIDIPDKLKVETINAADLHADWRSFRNYIHCQPHGYDWYKRSEAPVLKVPSAILPEEFNYVVNTLHAGFGKIKIVNTVDLVPDPRIEEILKGYGRSK